MSEQQSNFRVTGNAGALYTALARAQANFKPILKSETAHVEGFNKAGNKYTYDFDYADIAAIKAATVPALNAEGFCLIEPPCSDSGNGLELRVILGHAEGSIECMLRIPREAKVQETGSALTYYRRYMITGLLGVAAEDDDDGNIADENQFKAQPKRPETRPQQPRKTPPERGWERPREPKAETKPEAPKEQPKPDPRPATQPPVSPHSRPATIPPRPPIQFSGPGITPETTKAIEAALQAIGLSNREGSTKYKEVTGRSVADLAQEGGEASAVVFLGYLKKMAEEQGVTT